MSASTAPAAACPSRRARGAGAASATTSRCRASRHHAVATATTGPDVSVQPGLGKAQKAVVVGAGVGGLAMSARLARAGYEVTLVEKNPGVGGRMQSYSPPGAPGFRFDTGPSLLLFPDKYRECFSALGEDIEAHVDLKRVCARGRAEWVKGQGALWLTPFWWWHRRCRPRTVPTLATAPTLT
jgi:phytoene desaturase (3,4-didehydrolycopene-forming)